MSLSSSLLRLWDEEDELAVCVLWEECEEWDEWDAAALTVAAAA